MTYEIRSISQMGGSEPFELQVARGQIPGHLALDIYAYNPSFGNVEETVWEGSGVYTYPTEATQMSVSSSEDTDTSTVTIWGLDADYNFIEEAVVVTGQTPLTTTQSFLRINYVFVTQDSPGGQMYIGTGTVTAGVPAEIYGYVNGDNVSLSSVYTVPAGHTLYLDRGTISVTSDPAATINGRLMVRPFGQVFRTAAIINAINAYVEFNWSFPIRVPEKTDLEARVRCLKNQTNSATVSFEGVLIKDGGPL